MSLKCFYFGCWKEAGHYLFAPGGRWVAGLHLSGVDALFAPRKRRDGSLCWLHMATDERERRMIEYRSEEYPQGQFLRHELGLAGSEWCQRDGFTVIQWWDRTQGDHRPNSNSTILLESVHTSEEMLAALAEHFPHVLANLTAAGIVLVEVKKP